jgi:hypothetical protein
MLTFAAIPSGSRGDAVNLDILSPTPLAKLFRFFPMLLTLSIADVFNVFNCPEKILILS